MNASKRKIFLIGTGAMLWAMWLSRNEIVFDKTPVLSYMQVIHRATHWTRAWSVFQKEEERNMLQDACRLLETLKMEIFVKYGWRFSNRLCF
jgi:hypothetical protein